MGGDIDLQGRRATLGRMLDTLALRGPDDRGLEASATGGIGMTRLSIIDLAGGHQPMTDERRARWVVQNGEIYNYRELTAELVGQGHTFRSRSDTEVLVHGWEQWGPELPTHLRGMYAFAVWMPDQREVFLAVDRSGIKPLYYAETASGLVFASELKAILATGLVTTEVDWQALSLYFAFGHIPAPHTVYRQIRKLSPAHCLHWKNGDLTLAQYWDLPVEDPELILEGLDDRVEAELHDAVKSHLVSDVPVGAFLSGGMDSSCVVALAAQASSAPIKTFTIGFAESAYDERSTARTISAKYHTEHHELLIDRASVATLPRMLSYFDEPFADSSAIPTYHVARLAREHVKVALSGDGGDELLLGYKYFLSTWISLRTQKVPSAARAFARLLIRSLPDLPGFSLNGPWTLLRQRSIDCLSDPITTFTNKQALVGRSLLLESFRNGFREHLDFSYPEEYLAEIIESRMKAAPHSTLEPFAYAAYRFSLPSDMLVKVDRMSMANSLEVRVPLLDHKLTELVARIPVSVRMPGGRLKGLFRRISRPMVTRDVSEKPKTGFAMPLALWFKDDVNGFFGDLIKSNSSSSPVQPQAADKIIQRLRSGDQRSSATLWTLLMFELWRATSGVTF